MIHPHQLLAIAGWGVILGLLLGGYLTAPFLLIVCSLVLILIFLFRRPIFGVGSLFVICLLIGHLRYSYVLYSLTSQQIPSGEVSIEGVVASDVSLLGNSQNFDILVTLLDEEPVHFKTSHQLWSREKLSYGDKVEAIITIEPVMETYYLKDGVIAKSQTVDLIKTEAHRGFLIKRSLYSLRDSIASKINSFLSSSASSLVNGLLLGLRQDLSDELKSNLKNSGTTHIVALSGFNITIIIAFFLSIFKALPKRVTYLLSALAILAFVVMTGAASSVVRAGIMGGIFLLASMWSRRRHAGNALMLAVVVMILINPLILQYDIGFQLSMAATLGLIYISPHLAARIPKSTIWEVLSSTLAASLATLPLLVYHFGGLSLISLVANLLVVPLVPIVMLLGFVGLVLNLLGNFWVPLNFLIELPALLLIRIVNFFGTLPGAFVELPTISAWLVALYYCGMVVILIKLYDRRKRPIY